MLIHSDDRVVAGEAEFLVHSEGASFVLWDVKDRLLDATIGAVFHILSPRGNIRQSLDRVGPLPAQETTRWVLEVESEQEGVILVKVLSVHVRAEAHCLHKDLPESSCVHFLCVIAALELVFSLRVLPLEQLFEGFQYNESLTLMSHLRVKLEDSLCITLSLSLLPSRLFRHLKALVDTWKVHLLESSLFALAWS